MKKLLCFLFVFVNCYAEEASAPIIKAAQEALAVLQGKPGAVGVMPLSKETEDVFLSFNSTYIRRIL